MDIIGRICGRICCNWDIVQNRPFTYRLERDTLEEKITHTAEPTRMLVVAEPDGR
jgi:hypothetical protein